MTLNNRLKETRLEKDLTQSALAEKVRVSRQTIISIEKEKFVPSVKLALELASALETTVDTLFWLENNQGVS
jgi:putative transcriptional regulator